jgi:methyltransferase (TIGR00027 family)
MGRALAHVHRTVRGFDDPFAIDLLPDDCRAAVRRLLDRQWPRSRREAILGLVARWAETLIGPRTVEIDDGLRALPRGFQLVVLGAGLDARAYRMPELAESVAFEVDHPATQAFKRTRTSGWSPLARELHHAAVDFERESVGDALSRAGHRTDVPTAWVFEGVITYLTPRDVGATLDQIAARSAPGSRLLATYNEPSRLRLLFQSIMRRTSEPARAAFEPDEMRRLLETRGFVVHSDRDGNERALRWIDAPTRSARRRVRFHHVVVADIAQSKRSPR